MFNAIVIGWFISFGWVPQQIESVGNHKFEILGNMTATMTQIGLDATFDDRLRVFTEIDNYQYKENTGMYFLPYRVDYTFGGEFTVNKYISITATHTCIHDVVYTTGHQPDGYAEFETKVYATLRGSTKIR